MSERIRISSRSSTDAAASAAERLAAGLAAATGVPADLRIHLVDVADGLPGDWDGPSGHGLTGAQAHRVVVRGRDVLLLGHGPLGMAYAVERFRRDRLHLDPLASWTGIGEPPAAADLRPGDDLVPPPVFAHRIYFENDSDELINWSGRRLQLEWPVWKELLDTLIALGYSGLDVCDSLGRSEFLHWDHYRAETRFALDRELIERVFAYARRRGMVIVRSMALVGLPPDRTCWSSHGEEWKVGWRRHLTETSAGQADIVSIGLGDPMWDGDYRCRCERCVATGIDTVRAQFGRALLDVIAQEAPRATVLLTTYGPEGPRIPLADERLVIEISDHGYAELPAETAIGRPGPKGALLHAGFWLDHTVLNPYLARIGDSVRRLRDAGATRWLRINGQTFRPFMLTIEALATAAWDPDGYDAGAFARSWAACRLGAASAAPYAAFVDALFAANEAVRTGSKERGYVQLLIAHVLPLFRRLLGDEADIANADLVKCRSTDAIMRCFGDEGSTPEHARAVRGATRAALDAALRLRGAVDGAGRIAFVEDQAVFPARLFDALAAIYERQTRILSSAAPDRGDLDALVAETRALYDLHLDGPDHPRWRDWYLPNRQRIFGAPPQPELAEAVRRRLVCGTAIGV